MAPGCHEWARSTTSGYHSAAAGLGVAPCWRRIAYAFRCSSATPAPSWSQSLLVTLHETPCSVAEMAMIAATLPITHVVSKCGALPLITYAKSEAAIWAGE
jgi:hypothetical protein